jgi:hypothetical protein
MSGFSRICSGFVQLWRLGTVSRRARIPGFPAGFAAKAARTPEPDLQQAQTGIRAVLILKTKVYVHDTYSK